MKKATQSPAKATKPAAQTAQILRLPVNYEAMEFAFGNQCLKYSIRRTMELYRTPLNTIEDVTAVIRIAEKDSPLRSEALSIWVDLSSKEIARADKPQALDAALERMPSGELVNLELAMAGFIKRIRMTKTVTEVKEIVAHHRGRGFNESCCYTEEVLNWAFTRVKTLEDTAFVYNNIPRPPHVSEKEKKDVHGTLRKEAWQSLEKLFAKQVAKMKAKGLMGAMTLIVSLDIYYGREELFKVAITTLRPDEDTLRSFIKNSPPYRSVNSLYDLHQKVFSPIAGAVLDDLVLARIKPDMSSKELEKLNESCQGLQKSHAAICKLLEKKQPKPSSPEEAKTFEEFRTVRRGSKDHALRNRCFEQMLTLADTRDRFECLWQIVAEERNNGMAEKVHERWLEWAKNNPSEIRNLYFQVYSDLSLKALLQSFQTPSECLDLMERIDDRSGNHHYHFHRSDCLERAIGLIKTPADGLELMTRIERDDRRRVDGNSAMKAFMQTLMVTEEKDDLLRIGRTLKGMTQQMSAALYEKLAPFFPAQPASAEHGVAA
ncbi:MAG: hypothetical protein V4526_00170 [Patescibacteria group bacterium]